MKTETCEACKKSIGLTEQAHLFNNRVVCGECRKRMERLGQFEVWPNKLIVWQCKASLWSGIALVVGGVFITGFMLHDIECAAGVVFFGILAIVWSRIRPYLGGPMFWV